MPQQQLDSERAVILALMVGADLSSCRLAPEDFADPQSRAALEGIQGCVDGGEPVDPITVINQAKWMGLDIGPDYFADLFAHTFATAENIEAYSDLVRAASLRRRLTQSLKSSLAMIEGQGAKLQDVVACLERELSSIEDRHSKDLLPIGEYAADFQSRLEAIRSGTAGIVGLPTGFSELDRLTCGFGPGELEIIAARPGMGKTAFAMAALDHIATQHGSGLFVSLEMSGAAIYSRLACSEARVDLLRFRSGKISAQEGYNLERASNEIKAKPIWLVDSAVSGSDLAGVKAAIRRSVRKCGCKVAVVDYLQLVTIRGHKGNRENEVSTISRSMKQLSRELGIPVVCLSQLSRECEKRENKRPMLSDLRESGAIEQDADLILGLYRDDYYHKEKRQGIAEVIVMKQRNGPTSTVEVQFDSAFARFGNLDRNRQEYETQQNIEEGQW